MHIRPLPRSAPVLRSTLRPYLNGLFKRKEIVGADMRIIVIPLGSGVESRWCTYRLKPHQLAVIAMIDGLALVLCGENLRRNRYMLGRYLVQECSIGTATHRRAARFVTLFAPHRGDCGAWEMGSQEQKGRDCSRSRSYPTRFHRDVERMRSPPAAFRPAYLPIPLCVERANEDEKNSCDPAKSRGGRSAEGGYGCGAASHADGGRQRNLERQKEPQLLTRSKSIPLEGAVPEFGPTGPTFSRSRTDEDWAATCSSSELELAFGT